MQNQSNTSANMVVKGTAPEDSCPQMKKLRMKETPKTKLGRRRPVPSAADFQLVPFNVLKRRPP
jgi:hypothetical protein